MADKETNTELKQFKLADEGDIYFQPDPTNPLPGEKVGRIVKGAALMQPEAEVTADGMDAARVKAWLAAHIGHVLEPLAIINDEEQIQQQARDITARLYEALGILPRSELEELIAGLDEEGRRALRQRKVRLGPVLVFLPMLSKPASVRLRALLWNLWHGKELPASTPADGVTSVSIADQDIDPLYYRAIGYPVYGKRAIRVDMLDRLIVAIYDSADKGIFKAQHDMAEWLGCPIPDLYEVLEAMDHKKIHDPAEEKIEEEADKPVASAPAADSGEAAEPKAEEGEAKEEAPAADAAKEDKPAETPQEKPELATFKLRRGRAYGRPPVSAGGAAGQKPKGKKPVKKNQKPKRGGPRKEPQKERVISAMAKKNVDDSPFAALKDLKLQNKE